MSDRIIRASEINSYVYCARAWWLGAIEGVQPANIRELDAGTLAHARHGQAVIVAGWAQRIAVALLLFGAVLAIAWFAAGFS
jgi:hypothetical protein